MAILIISYHSYNPIVFTHDNPRNMILPEEFLVIDSIVILIVVLMILLYTSMVFMPWFRGRLSGFWAGLAAAFQPQPQLSLAAAGLAHQRLRAQGAPHRAGSKGLATWSHGRMRMGKHVEASKQRGMTIGMTIRFLVGILLFDLEHNPIW